MDLLPDLDQGGEDGPTNGPEQPAPAIQLLPVPAARPLPGGATPLLHPAHHIHRYTLRFNEPGVPCSLI